MLRAYPSFSIMAGNKALNEWPSDLVAIGTCANVSFVSNRQLLKKLDPCNFRVNGATGEGGGSEIGELPGFGYAAILPHCKINAISAAEVFPDINVTLRLPKPGTSGCPKDSPFSLGGRSSTRCASEGLMKSC